MEYAKDARLHYGGGEIRTQERCETDNSATSRASRVARDLERQLAEADRISAALGKLEERLSPLCRSNSRPGVGGGISEQRMVPGSVFAEAMNNLADRMKDFATRLYELADRLDI